MTGRCRGACAVAALLLGCGVRPASGLGPALGEVIVLEAPDAGTDGGAWFDDGGCGCAAWGSPTVAGPLADPQLVELSGLAASRSQPGVLWAHNDSGDIARFFGLGATGAALGRFVLDGGVAHDIEDVAVGPCPQGSCVYLGDIGDNLTARDDYSVYRVAEPAVDSSGDAGTVTVGFEHFDFGYPQGAHYNAETLLVHPVLGDVYVLTKHGAGTRSRVYRFPRPLNPSAKVVLEYVGEAPVPAAADLPLTGGDISPCGNALLLRMYNRAVLLRVPAGMGFESIFTSPAVAVPVATEPQGEAIAWSADGRGYFTSSEGTSQSLARVACP